MSWQPSASIEQLKQRALIINQIRDFFAQREVLEVTTPLLGLTTASDPHIDSFQVGNYFLQTSPEYPMKRLLAAGSGPIYQISPAFRQEEQGRYHNPEFTILEWYRPGFDHHQLMAELCELMQLLLATQPAEKITYRNLFKHYLQVDPFELPEETDFDELFSIHIMPKLGLERPIYVYDFPANQAALAKIRDEQPPVGERFELVYKGIELANGYHELLNPDEQRQRFIEDNLLREKMGKISLPIPEKLLQAQQHGMPDCAGVALGVDRVLMIALNAKHISETMSFAADYL